MKEIFSLFVFGIGALCLAVFFTTVAPVAITPAVGPDRLGLPSTTTSATLLKSPQLLAAALRPAVGRQ
jgi:hypothetical protein